MASWANSRAAVMECRCDESSMSRGVMYVPNVPRPAPSCVPCHPTHLSMCWCVVSAMSVWCSVIESWMRNSEGSMLFVGAGHLKLRPVVDTARGIGAGTKAYFEVPLYKEGGVEKVATAFVSARFTDDRVASAHGDNAAVGRFARTETVFHGDVTAPSRARYDEDDDPRHPWGRTTWPAGLGGRLASHTLPGERQSGRAAAEHNSSPHCRQRHRNPRRGRRGTRLKRGARTGRPMVVREPATAAAAGAATPTPGAVIPHPGRNATPTTTTRQCVARDGGLLGSRRRRLQPSLRHSRKAPTRRIVIAMRGAPQLQRMMTALSPARQGPSVAAQRSGALERRMKRPKLQRVTRSASRHGENLCILSGLCWCHDLLVLPSGAHPFCAHTLRCMASRHTCHAPWQGNIAVRRLHSLRRGGVCSTRCSYNDARGWSGLVRCSCVRQF